MFPIYLIPLFVMIPIVLWIVFNEKMELDRLQKISSKLDEAIHISGLRLMHLPRSSAMFYSSKAHLISQIDRKIDLLLKNEHSIAGIHFSLRHLSDPNRKYNRLERKLDKLISLIGAETTISLRMKRSVLHFSNIRIFDQIIIKADSVIEQIRQLSVESGG